MTLGETTKRTNDKRCSEGKYKGITHTLPEIQEPSNRQLIYGLRWHCADSKHDICIQAAGNQHREFDCISHKVNQIHQWAQSLHERIGDVIAAALELTKGPLSMHFRSMTAS